ncbi:MAG: hypothetical protein Q7T77_04745 [Sulfuricurvum sp.]|nr:hypothetical protein [Sulfuricurvum sp.]
MKRLTKSQRKVVNQKASELHHTENSLTLQQNNYHMDASEIDALHRMQDHYPELVDRILSFKQQEIDTQNKIVNIEVKEQSMREGEIPYIRAYAFIGQFMAYSIGGASLAGGAYFGYNNDPVTAGLFLTSTVGIAFAQFFKIKSKKEDKEKSNDG